MRLAIWALVVLAVAPCHGEEWSRFRGPNGAGIATDSGYPIEFSQTENVVWRTPVRKGKSSPILTETRVFLTAFEDGKLYTQCFDRFTGEMLWERFEPRPRKEIAHRFNEPSASSPVVDGENVYVFFHEFGLISYDREGELRWKLPLGPFHTPMGHAASPILSDGSVILLVDQGDGGFISSYSTRNGELNWRTAREERHGWATPLVYQPDGGEPQIITASNLQLNAHSLATGKSVWVHEGSSPAVAPSPVMSGSTIYSFGYGVQTSPPFEPTLTRLDSDNDGKLSPREYGEDPWLFRVGQQYAGPDRNVTQEAWSKAYRALDRPSALVAVRLDPATMESRELWRYERNFFGVVPSPIVVDGILYLVKSGGILTAFNAETGEVIKAGRLTGAVDPYWASPVSAEGHIYFASEEGNIAVVEAGEDWKVLTGNSLDEPMYATPALSQGHIYVRTEAALYRFGVTR